MVTGGGKGIGKGISIRLAEAGAEVVIVGNSNMAMAEETAALIGSRGGKAYTFGIDLSKPESAAKVLAKTCLKRLSDIPAISASSESCSFCA